MIYTNYLQSPFNRQLTTFPGKAYHITGQPGKLIRSLHGKGQACFTADLPGPNNTF